jgi:penicillin-binding protein 1C
MSKSRKAAILLAIVIAAFLGFKILYPIFLNNFVTDPQILITNYLKTGGVLLDRHQQPLRLFPNKNGDFVYYIPLASYSKNIINAVLTAEDRNFFKHPGYDISAMLRAAWQNITSGKIVSGASTITQQVIRILWPRPRTFSTKISEILIASRLESQLSKNEILELYLNLVPMFGNTRGISLAARLLFGKAPNLTNISESAVLAALPQSPTYLSPFKRKSNLRLLKRKNWIINEMAKLGYISVKDANLLFKETIPTWQHKKPFRAPHFCNWILKENHEIRGTITTTLDVNIQELLHKSIQANKIRLNKSGATQACGMILDNKNMNILAMVGSIEYGPLSDGYNNGCTAHRSGGSILKPFLYALALEKSYYPSFVIPDTMRTFKTPQGDYLPYNANRKSYGPVTIRTALGNSLNISAVKMLNLIGINDFFNFLVELQILQQSPEACSTFGLGLAIGNPEVSMLDIAQAYGIFANNGLLKNIKYLKSQKNNNQSKISEETAFIITNIMADPTARLLTFGNPDYFKFSNPTALKTGTSTNYRDSWIIAITPRHIVCLWAGNFDGSPTRGLGGASACGPILKKVLEKLEGKNNPGSFYKPEGIRQAKVCGISGKKPSVFCPVTATDFVPRQIGELPECDFHQSTGNFHQLPANYARWVKSRSQTMKNDPFQLRNYQETTDPYFIPGISSKEGEQVKSDADSSKQSIPQISIGQSSQANNSWNKLRIVSPHDGDRFVLSASNENYVRLRAIPETTVPEITWLIDGSEYIRTAPPYEAYWPMKQGQHTITALTESEVAAQITILVER